MSKHTPGPWVFEYDNDVGDNDDYFIEFFSVRTQDSNELIARVEEKTDARLIAAAPDLLEALQVLCEYAETSNDFRYGTLSTKFVRDVALPAIAKATGEQE